MPSACVGASLPVRRRPKAGGSGQCELFFLCRHGGGEAITQRLERIAAFSLSARKRHNGKTAAVQSPFLCPSGGDRLSPVISPHIPHGFPRDGPLKAARSCAASIPPDACSANRRGGTTLGPATSSAGRESVFAGRQRVVLWAAFPRRRLRSAEGGSHQQAQRILLPAHRSAGRRKGKSARRRSFHAFLILRRDQSFFCSSSCCFFSSSSRRARRSTLPTMDLGSSSRNSKMRGTL